MNGFYILAVQARLDIDEITGFVAAKNVEAGVRLLDKFIDKFETLANFPNIGRRRDDLAPRLRSLPVEEYLIFYQPIEGGVQIARVVSGYRDLDTLFSEQDESW